MKKLWLYLALLVFWLVGWRGAYVVLDSTPPTDHQHISTILTIDGIPLLAHSRGGWCPSPPNNFIPCDNSRAEKISIRWATPTESWLLSGEFGPASPWILEGWSQLAAAFGLPPIDPRVDFSREALEIGAHLPEFGFLANIPIGFEAGKRLSLLDIIHSGEGSFPWRTVVIETRSYSGQTWTILAESKGRQPPNAFTLGRLLQGIDAIFSGGIESPSSPDPNILLWAQIVSPDGPRIGSGRAWPGGNGWYAQPPFPEAPDTPRLIEETRIIRERILSAVESGEADPSLVLAFARAAIRSASGPPIPRWGAAPAACGRGLPIGNGVYACLLPDGRMAAARTLETGDRYIWPLKTSQSP